MVCNCKIECKFLDFLGFIKFVSYDLSTFVLKNLRQLFDKYAVARTEHNALVKSTTKIFSNFENANFTRKGVEQCYLVQRF